MMIKNIYKSPGDQGNDASKLDEKIENAINSTVSKALLEISETSKSITKKTGNTCFFFFVYANGQYNDHAYRKYVGKVTQILKNNWTIKTVTDQDLGQLHTIYRETGGHLSPSGYLALSAEIKKTLSDSACI